jgi:hypothetical protein
LISHAATALFLANFALVQFGMVDTKPLRWLHHGWLHHALFFAAFASAALALGVGYLQGAPYRWALLLVLTLLVVLPRVRAGTTGHVALTSLAMIFYATGFVFLL